MEAERVSAGTTKLKENERAPIGAAAGAAALGVLQLMWSLDHALQVRSRRMARELGVTGPQRLALRLIATEQITSPGLLARRLVLDKSTVTGIVSRLEQQGLLERARHTSDGRRLLLALTPAGRRLARRHDNTIESVVAQVIRSGDRSELRHASAFLRRLGEALLSSSTPSRRARPRKAGGGPLCSVTSTEGGRMLGLAAE
jgi:DNA-binding MarR family transcriptional regulator